jgi:hypothetical protein
MKLFIAVLLVAVPAAAQAMGMHGKGGYAGSSSASMHLVTVLYALVAALGYWVLQHADKDTRGLVKKTGHVVAWTLIVLGLMGFLCGIGAHVTQSAAKCSGKCPSEMMEGGQAGGGGQQAQPMHMGKMMRMERTKTQ